MEWWKIVLIISGVVSIVALKFAIYACVRVGARSDKEGKDDED